MELRRGSILGSHLEEDVDSKTETEVSSSESWLSMSRHTPHGAYWIEQQNRLPLPLMEVVENEALEILTKALWRPSTLEIQFPRLTQNRVPSVRATPSHPRFLKSHMQRRCWGAHALLTALSGALSSRLPVRDGPDHFLTKQLQRYIEGLKRRRSKRLHLVMY
ncbi:cation channel sperm-associated auxiliary subunit zeta-like [Canis lupus dingo]|uniref:cation channel sperm-associated auxiliary subunit zeta-like n=1 Tax=Canis lupus dingo TaxID=286419 RepID=UPI0020C5984B|nr:cation channel sperm-associated auxiliary subunit zeta-like [Canis lupus dingo]